MRLTKYKPQENSMFPYQLKDDELRTRLDGVHKLGQLEDIEEKLKVGLTVLFKALEQDYIYIYQVALPFGDLDKDRIVKLSMLQFFKSRGKDDDWCIIGQKTYDNRGDNFVTLKQYGKKWALTREELNNETDK